MSPTKPQHADALKRPKGILKNSYHNPLPSQTSPTAISPPTISSPTGPDPDHTISEKDLTLQNTLQNAGHRRSSSNPRASISRRQSAVSGAVIDDDDENNPRLKWDEANLFLTEQEKSSTMKINEPKTPYAKHYDPSDDVDEPHTLDADDLVVDELDQAHGARKSRTRESDIPGLELGEPEEMIPETGLGAGLDGHGSISRSGSAKGEKQVVVDSAVDMEGGHGEMEGWSREEKEKHRKFEEMRKKHYEMKDVKDLLGHPEIADVMDEDEEGSQGMPLPIQSRGVVNGS